jgi:release factor glutamine methyltransferase
MRLVRLPGVFQPISDSWMLADQLRREALREAAVLDLCTGSGMVAVTAALHGASEVVAVDVSRRALLSARLNAAVNGVRVVGRRGDLMDAVNGQRFDFIVSNPPYVPSPSTELPTRGPERAWDAGPDGRMFIDRICAAAPAHLHPGGVVLIVQSVICDEARTLEAFRRAGLSAKVVFRHVGGLGPLMRDRAAWLRDRGLLHGDRDEVIVVRAQLS